MYKTQQTAQPTQVGMHKPLAGLRGLRDMAAEGINGYVDDVGAAAGEVTDTAKTSLLSKVADLTSGAVKKLIGGNSANSTTPTPTPASTTTETGSSNTMWYVLGGAAAIGGVAYFVMKPKKKSTKRRK